MAVEHESIARSIVDQFKQIDRSGHGLIHRAAVVTLLHGATHFNPQDINRILDAAGVEENGMVMYEAFVTWLLEGVCYSSACLGKLVSQKIEEIADSLTSISSWMAARGATASSELLRIAESLREIGRCSLAMDLAADDRTASFRIPTAREEASAPGAATGGSDSLLNVLKRGLVPQMQSPSTGHSSATRFPTIKLSTLSKNIVDCEYAVRGKIVLRAEEIKQQLVQGCAVDEMGDPVGFDSLVFCNIGNPQAVGGKPLAFHRQVLACLMEPSLLEQRSFFPEDVRERASNYLAGVKDGRLGAYSHSKGHIAFRKDVADFLTQRDGHQADPDHIFLTDGASVAVRTVLQLVIGGPNDGVMLPIPQYPLYSAVLTLLGGQSVGYYLDEEAGWAIGTMELERGVREFRASGGNPRAIAVINPGNPTGQVLSREVMEEVLRFAERECLALLADEVYQDNIHVDGKEWISFRKLAMDIGSKIEVFSFHSVSKGVTGECGLRGGFVHCHNVDPQVLDEMYKLASVNLCSNTMGQALMASTVNPPPLDGPSRALFDAERDSVQRAYRRKARLVTKRLNAIDGISCQPIEGAMYAFPQVTIKGYIMKKATSMAMPADQVYCMELLNRTGVVTVPGSGFGQKPGTFHLRMTILPDEPTLEQVLDRIERFHMEHSDGWFK